MNTQTNESRVGLSTTSSGMDITKIGAKGLFRKGMNALKAGDFEGASKNLEHLNKHGAWWHARALGSAIKKETTKNEDFLAKYNALNA